MPSKDKKTKMPKEKKPKEPKAPKKPKSPKAPKAPKVPKEDADRTFTVESKGGRYKSKNPISAAKKAASKLFKKGSAKTEITFTIRETTAGSAKKTYKYLATRTKKVKPVKVVIKGVEIVYEYDITVKSV